jgi:hypothetical protein
MLRWLTRNRLVWLTVSAVAVFLLVNAFATPAAHDVQSPGGVSLHVGIASQISPDRGPILVSIKPSQSLAEMRCEVWRADPRAQNRSDKCPDDSVLALTYWPQLKQSPRTLYVAWPSCGIYYYLPTGVQTVYSDLNVEYLGSGKTLIIHCYFARARIWFPGPPGVSAEAVTALLVVPTDDIPPGPLTVVVDYRIEHLLGDDSTAYPLGTAAIS